MTLDGTTSRALIHIQAEAADQLALRHWNRTQEYDPTFTLDRHVSEARERLGEERWAELDQEWQ